MRHIFTFFKCSISITLLLLVIYSCSKDTGDIDGGKRWEYTKDDWIKLLKRELAYGRPMMIVARTATSPKPGDSGMVSGHWFNIEGYDSSNKFYINYNYGQPFSGYYDVDDFGVYNSYGLVVIGFKPR